MSDEGEKVCPLCTEEMDLTDQQLKPCRCGYQICVWCWHHIMDMAEKDATEGRCPACRMPYDKEKIVGMASSCESRLVAEINSERKFKSQKAKSKTNEGRKHLSSVRVIQKNLVYIIGIPSNLADEDVLQHREYFGQYGKVLKVSISRTAGGAIQHSANNTCSVYITYSKEEEAVRCIQSVHGYVLDGKSLRACFGTTKYCHAWLRNMSCSNPDCLYLHDIGTQEDSFSKDEIVSAFTRSRVQQITGATNNLQRRSGMVLPPPCDDFSYQETASVAKPISKNVQNNPATQSKGSPPDGSSGRSSTLPAAASWGLRVSNGRPPTADGPAKQKPDTCNGLFSSVVASSSQGSMLHTDVAKKSVITEESHIQHPHGRLESSESSKQHIVTNCRPTVSDASSKVVRTVPSVVTASNQLSGPPTSRDSEMGSLLPPDRPTCSLASDKDDNVAANGTLHSLCSGLESIDVNNDFRAEYSDATKPSDTDHNFLSFKSNGSQGMQQYYTEHVRESPTTLASRKASNSDSVSVSIEQSDWRLETPIQATTDAYSELEDGVLSFDERRLKVSEVNPSYLFHSPNSFKDSNHIGHALQHGDACSSTGLGYSDPVTLHTKFDADLLPFKYSDAFTSNGFFQNKISSSAELGNGSVELGMSSKYSSFSSNTEEGKYMGRFSNDAAFVDMGESSIISDILSLDNDVWDNSLTSPHNLAKLLNETDKQQGSFKISNSWKAQNSNQSRFSFARQEDFPNQGSDLQPSFCNTGLVTHNCSDPRDFMGNRDPYLDRLRNGFSSSFLEEPETFPGTQLPISSDRFSVSRAQISAPPGFSLPSRTPPPGFSSQERFDQPFDAMSGHNLLESSSLLRNQYQAQAAQPSGNLGDVEFIDPAILAVGKGRRPSAMNNLGYDMRSTFSSQLNGHESDPRLQFLLQQSISSHQNLRYPEHIGDRFSPMTDAYRNPSRFPEQTQINNLSPFGQLSLQQQSSRNAHMSNGHWDSWSEVQNGNELSMAELLRNERLGFNKHYPSYEDLKYRMPSSGDMYNRAFGM